MAGNIGKDPQPMEYEMTRLDDHQQQQQKPISRQQSEKASAGVFSNTTSTSGFKQLFSRLKSASREKSTSLRAKPLTTAAGNEQHPAIVVLADERRPDPLALMEALKQPRLRKHQWNSPVVEDELYVAILLLDGDVDQLKQAGLSSQINIAHSHTSINLQPSPTATDESQRLDEMMEQIHLSSNTNTIATNEINPSQSSTGNLRAPLLPKRPMRGAEKSQPDSRIAQLAATKNKIKFNSCTTLFTIDNTLFRPSQTPEYIEITLKSIAHAILSHMDRTYLMFTEMQKFDRLHQLCGQECFAPRVIRTRDYFSERLYPVWKVRAFPERVMEHPEIIQSPTFDEIFLFLKQLFNAMDLSAEVAIIMLIYLERLMVRTGLTLHGVNCFRVIIGALSLASKVWDDEAVWLDDMRTIMPDLNTRDLKTLERWWLRKIDFDVGVKRALFAKYWFEIREVAERNWGVRLSHMRVVLHSGTEPAASLLDLPSSSSYKRSTAAVSTSKTTQGLLLEKSDSSQRQQQQQQLPSALGTSLGILGRKPLTEDDFKQISAAVMTSQAKLRQSFNESLSAGPFENLIGGSYFSWTSLTQIPSSTAAYSATVPKHQSMMFLSTAAAVTYTGNSSSSASAAAIATKSRSSMLAPTTGSSAYSSALSFLSNKSGGPIGHSVNDKTTISTAELQETVVNSFNKDVTDFGWGGSKLRRAKSDDSFKPSVPLASVL
jgi:hypothetical protein